MKKEGIRHLRNKQSKRNLETNLVIRRVGKKTKGQVIKTVMVKKKGRKHVNRDEAVNRIKYL